MKKRPINFGYLAGKYIQGADFVVEDRTYEGLVWRGPDEKPPLSFFEAAQNEEEREARRSGRKVELQNELASERHEQARARINAAMVDFEEKIRLDEEKIIEEIRGQKTRAIELASALRLREESLDSWEEITAAQAIINSEAEAYLKDTDFYVIRESEGSAPIPVDILDKRRQARERIVRGRLVYANWQQLQANEMPTRDEIQRAIKAGGSELERIRREANEVRLKYPRPRRESSYHA